MVLKLSISQVVDGCHVDGDPWRGTEFQIYGEDVCRELDEARRLHGRFVSRLGEVVLVALSPADVVFNTPLQGSLLHDVTEDIGFVDHRGNGILNGCKVLDIRVRVAPIIVIVCSSYIWALEAES